MPRILLVDNYNVAGKEEQLKKSLESNGATVTLISASDSSPKVFDEHDGVVLSGSPAMLSEDGSEAPFSGEMDAIRASRVPMLGICFGHQLMARAFGSTVLRGPSYTRRYVETEVLANDSLFVGLGKRISVYESHLELVGSVPKDFRLLATSPTSPVAAMRHKRLPIFGVQFHPEQNSAENPDGDTFVRNFVQACTRASRIAR